MALGFIAKRDPCHPEATLSLIRAPQLISAVEVLVQENHRFAGVSAEKPDESESPVEELALD